MSLLSLNRFYNNYFIQTYVIKYKNCTPIYYYTLLLKETEFKYKIMNKTHKFSS